MRVFGKAIEVSTKGFSDIVDLTGHVKRIADESGINDGLINVSAVGSTASITTIEFEPALVEDMKDQLEGFAPRTKRTRHSETWGDDNGFSHLRASFMGPALTIPLSGGLAVLGPWQQIVVIDHDNRPRERRIFVQIIGV